MLLESAGFQIERENSFIGLLFKPFMLEKYRQCWV
jgi:hypothetical protein